MSTYRIVFEVPGRQGSTYELKFYDEKDVAHFVFNALCDRCNREGLPLPKLFETKEAQVA